MRVLTTEKRLKNNVICSSVKLKKFNEPVFVVTAMVVAVLFIPALFAAFAEDEGTLDPHDTFWNFFAALFHVLRFPTHTLLWPLIIAGGPFTYIAGLLINCLFYGLIVERFFYLFRSRK